MRALPAAGERLPAVRGGRFLTEANEVNEGKCERSGEEKLRAAERPRSGEKMGRRGAECAPYLLRAAERPRSGEGDFYRR